MCAQSYTIPGSALNIANTFTVHGLRRSLGRTAAAAAGPAPGTHPTAPDADFPVDADGAGRDHA